MLYIMIQNRTKIQNRAKIPRRMVVCYGRFGTMPSGPRRMPGNECSYARNRADGVWLSQNVTPMLLPKRLGCVTSQKSANIVWTAARTWNHTEKDKIMKLATIFGKYNKYYAACILVSSIYKMNIEGYFTVCLLCVVYLLDIFSLCDSSVSITHCVTIILKHPVFAVRVSILGLPQQL